MFNSVYGELKLLSPVIVWVWYTHAAHQPWTALFCVCVSQNIYEFISSILVSLSLNSLFHPCWENHFFRRLSCCKFISLLKWIVRGVYLPHPWRVKAFNPQNTRRQQGQQGVNFFINVILDVCIDVICRLSKIYWSVFTLKSCLGGTASFERLYSFRQLVTTQLLCFDLSCKNAYKGHFTVGGDTSNAPSTRPIHFPHRQWYMTCSWRTFTTWISVKLSWLVDHHYKN